MAIESKYVEMLDAIEAIPDQLDEWETGFIFGDPDHPDKKKRRPPMRENSFLSRGRKEKIEEIYTKKILGEQWKRKSRTKFGIIKAEVDKERGYVISIDGHQIGEGITRKEAVAVAPWLHGALHEILSLPKGTLDPYKDGTPETKESEPKKPAKKQEPAVDPDCGF